MYYRLLYLLSAFLLYSSCEEEYVYSPPSGVTPPSLIFGDIYKDILIKDTLGISRQIANGFPKNEIREIKLAFRKQKNNEGFDVQSFVKEHWTLATPRQTGYVADTTSNILDISSELWSALTYDSNNQPEYSSLISLPHPYVSISGEQTEMRYMDSYFIMVGLAADDQWEMIEYMIDNCAYMIDTIGHIPETNRTYMTSRSGQPFFSHMVELLANHKGDEVYTKYLPQLEKEYKYWQKEKTELGEHNGLGHTIKLGDKLLNRYNDPNSEPRDEDFLHDRNGGNNLYRAKRANSESGWMMSSRWLGDKARMWTMFTRHVAPVDLNSLMYHLENTLIKSYTLAGDKNNIPEIQSSLDVRKLALDSLHWDLQKKIFEDVNYKKQAKTSRATLAMLYPLFTNMCSQEQADGVASFVESTLLKGGGLMDTDQYTDFEWDAPNAHAPLQYIAVKALDNYGHKSLAKKIATRYTQTIEKTFAVTGRITEMYNLSETEPQKMVGKYEGKDAYGWTLGVYLGLKKYLN